MEDFLPENSNQNNNNNKNDSDNNNKNKAEAAIANEAGESSSLRHRARNIEAGHKAHKREEDRGMKAKLLFCGHKFHKKCINDWLSRYSNTTQ